MTKFGAIFPGTKYLTILFTTADMPASVANLAPAPSDPAKTNELGDGGGKRAVKRNAAFMLIWQAAAQQSLNGLRGSDSELDA